MNSAPWVKNHSAICHTKFQILAGGHAGSVARGADFYSLVEACYGGREEGGGGNGLGNIQYPKINSY